LPVWELLLVPWLCLWYYLFSGLKVFSLSFTNEIDPDLKISSTLGKSFDFAKQEIEIKDIAGIASYTKIIEERVLFTFDDKQEVTYLKGVGKIAKSMLLNQNFITDSCNPIPIK
jgi:hypothetical protein